MIRGPQELLAITDNDKIAVEALEIIIDGSKEFRTYDGTEIKITLPKEAIETHLAVRRSVRLRMLQSKLVSVGWKYVWLALPVVHLGEHQPRSSDPRD